RARRQHATEGTPPVPGGARVRREGAAAMKRSPWTYVAVALLALAGERASGASSSGEIVVEVYSGFPLSAPALAPAPGHFVVDVTGMLGGNENASEDEQRQLAQKLIVPYLARHPGLGLESAAVHAFRRGQKQECPDATAGASLAAGDA